MGRMKGRGRKGKGEEGRGRESGRKERGPGRGKGIAELQQEFLELNFVFMTVALMPSAT